MRRFAVTGALLGAVLIAAAGGGAAAKSGHATPPRPVVAPLGAPVPAHVSATSVTFISTQTAFVLGTAPCTDHPCTSILRTSNRGVSWSGLPAPHEAISRPGGSGLWGLRFADAKHGYAFGNGLWTTGNGGASWKHATAPARYVFALEAVRDHELVAVASSCTFSTGGCSGRFAVYHRAISGGSWKRVATTGPSDYASSIAVHGSTVWVLAGDAIWVSTDGGRTFRAHGQPCKLTPSSVKGPSSIADDGAHTYLLCTGQGFLSHTDKYLYRTSGPHSSFIQVSKPPTPGDAGVLAAGSDQAIVLATASAASWLYRSADAGRHWGTADQILDGGEGWSDLGFTTPTDGVVIHGPATVDGGSSSFPGQLLLTSNGGRTWSARPF